MRFVLYPMVSYVVLIEFCLPPWFSLSEVVVILPVDISF